MSATSSTWLHRLLLAAAARSIDPQLVAGRSVQDWKAALGAAAAHGMQGWLAREVRGREDVPPEAQLLLQATALRLAANHRSHLQDAAGALDRLTAAGVEAMVLKGPALVERYYNDATVRPYGDVDVYVRPRSFARALDALENAGFKLLDRNWEFLHEDLRGQVHLANPEHRAVELHWHIVNGARQRKTLRLDPDELWDVVEESRLSGQRCFALPPAEEMAHLCLHAAGHGCNRLIWLADIAVLAESRVIDWDVVSARVRRWHFSNGTDLVLTLAREWFGAPIPEDAIADPRARRATMVAFRRLISGWDLSSVDTEGRSRELMFVAAGDDLKTRSGLLIDVIVPAQGQRSSIGGPAWVRQLHRVTLGTTGRVLGKFGLSEDHLAEYETTESRHDREGYLRAVEAQRSETHSALVVVSPSSAVGMVHYSRALVEAMPSNIPTTLLDAGSMSKIKMWRHLRRAARDPRVSVLVTSPHWSVPMMLWGLPVRGGFVFHDPILDAATTFTRPIHRLYYRILTAKLGVVILHGERFRRDVLRMKLRPRAIVTVPHGFVPQKLQVDSPYDPSGPILFIGRAQPYKGLAVLIDALDSLEDVPVVIAGEGVTDYRSPRSERVEIREGPLSDEGFRDLMARCCAVVLPYERANQSGVLATAFRAGRPVIASAVGAFEEYVTDGVNGFLVPPGDPTALAEAILRVTTDPALASEMARAARRSWDEGLSPSVCALEICASLQVAGPT